MNYIDIKIVPSFYQGYVNQVKHLPLMEALAQSHHEFKNLMQGKPESFASYRYAEEKWSVAELVCHMLDAERIFCYRALRFARKDQTVLSGFDENAYAPEANAASRTLAGLLQEAWHLRQSTLDLFNSFNEEMYLRKGKVNDNELSVLALGYIIAGHETHHRKVLQERYFTKA
ncbi:MAG: DinB family protein [Cyclobacteriaceae bacterium]|jgi:hypothetical protein|nr:DinB family protein [Cyclobacteriaceae bacterium]